MAYCQNCPAGSKRRDGYFLGINRCERLPPGSALPILTSPFPPPFGVSYSIGIDYGTSPVQALIDDSVTGCELGSGFTNSSSCQAFILLDPQGLNVAWHINDRQK